MKSALISQQDFVLEHDVYINQNGLEYSFIEIFWEHNPNNILKVVVGLK